MLACDAARVANGVSTKSHGWAGATTKEMPEDVAHATSVPAGLCAGCPTERSPAAITWGASS